LTVAVAQPRTVPGDLDAAVVEHAAAVREAAAARVVVFPELSLTGYALDAPAVDPGDPRLAPLVAACAETGALALAGAPVEEDAGRFIATLAVDAEGARVAYRKAHLGGDERHAHAAGDGPVTLDVDGWRVGLGICKDTGVAEHVEAVVALGVDLYLAGLVHHPDELAEQDARGLRIATACGAPVAFASAAGATGPGYEATAGSSTIWSPAGDVLARAGATAGDVAVATLTPSTQPG
jgi:predicted amidohydrolase